MRQNRLPEKLVVRLPQPTTVAAEGQAVQGDASNYLQHLHKCCRGQERFYPLWCLQQGCSKSKRIYTHTYNYNTTTLLPHARQFTKSHVRVWSAVPSATKWPAQRTGGRAKGEAGIGGGLHIGYTSRSGLRAKGRPLGHLGPDDS
jgi:hypothetical protein